MSKIPHIVIIGAGFGGLAAACKLAGKHVRVTLIDRQNHHLFQPLLYQLATAAVDASTIAWPIRALFRKHTNVDCLMGEIVGIDHRRKCVLLKNDEVHYDKLIIATGNVPNYFGNSELEQHTLPLKSWNMRWTFVTGFWRRSNAANILIIQRVTITVLISLLLAVGLQVLKQLVL